MYIQNILCTLTQISITYIHNLADDCEYEIPPRHKRIKTSTFKNVPVLWGYRKIPRYFWKTREINRNFLFESYNTTLLAKSMSNSDENKISVSKNPQWNLVIVVHKKLVHDLVIIIILVIILLIILNDHWSELISLLLF